MNDQAKGLLITFFGVLFVVPDSLFVRLIDAQPLTIAFWRLFIAGGATALWLLIRQGFQPFQQALHTGVYGFVYIVGVGASGVLFIIAVSLTSVANVVFIIASLPVFAALFSRIFLGEGFGTRTVLTIVGVVPGLSIIAYGSGETHNAHISGDLLALCVSALFAAALTAARHVRPVSMVPAMAMGYLGAAILIAPFAVPFDVGLDQAPLIAAHGGFVLCSAVLLAVGPRYLTSAEVGLLVLLESILAPLLAWAAVGENPGACTLLGGAIVVGVLCVSNVWLLFRMRRA